MRRWRRWYERPGPLLTDLEIAARTRRALRPIPPLPRSEPDAMDEQPATIEQEAA